MRFMHTADWHVGKVLKGRDRLDEQRAVLAEIAQIAERSQVDAVLVAGDVYDTGAPSAPAQKLVVQTLLRRQEAVLGALGLGGVEPSGDLDGAVGEDAALDLAGGLLRADEDDAE